MSKGNDSGSEEATSAENLSIHKFKTCSTCKNEICSRERLLCSCCFTEICNICVAQLENPLEVLCKACQRKAKRFGESLVKEVEEKRRKNADLVLELMKICKERQEVLYGVKEKRREIEEIQRKKLEVEEMRMRFKLSVKEVLAADCEVSELHGRIEELVEKEREKSEKAEGLERKIQEGLEELQIFQSENRPGPLREEDLAAEHETLTEKIRNIETSTFSYLTEMKEAVQALRHQMVVENSLCEKTQLQKTTFLESQEINNAKKKVRLLQEELNITNRHLDLLKKGKIRVYQSK